jgi:hypothetical protein
MTVLLLDSDFQNIEFYKTVNLPKIPEKLIDDLSTIQKKENQHQLAPDIYGTYHVSESLYNFVQSKFKNKVKVMYQLIKKDLPIHKDKVIDYYKLNYVIDLGGNNVKTRWFTDQKDTIILETILEPKVWYALNVFKYHDVINLTSPRLSITVKTL